ncbi:MAG: flagellar basal body P-ring formation protein FlgA [Rhodobacteraceae bacterium]|jgi:flagella basal body P-ring formation protein FlgA|nr:flagellar basal body P-ring formation protein FlgA [Paracoccaceae bacterium]
MILRLALTGCVLAVLAAPAARGETLLAARTLRANTVIGPADVTVSDSAAPGALSRPDDALGLETRVTVYAGRPLHAADLGPPAMIERNQIVPLLYRRGALSIETEARALERGAAGARIRVMNLDSKATLTATVTPTGAALVD